MRKYLLALLVGLLLSACGTGIKVPPAMIGNAAGAAGCGFAATQLKPSVQSIIKQSIDGIRVHLNGEAMTLAQINALLLQIDAPPVRAALGPVLGQLSRFFADTDLVPKDNPWFQGVTGLLDTCSMAFGVQTEMYLESSVPETDAFVISKEAFLRSTK